MLNPYVMIPFAHRFRTSSWLIKGAQMNEEFKDEGQQAEGQPPIEADSSERTSTAAKPRQHQSRRHKGGG